MDKLEMLNRKKQFLVSELGEDKLKKLMTALDKFCNDNAVDLIELEDVVHLKKTIRSILPPTSKDLLENNKHISETMNKPYEFNEDGSFKI